MFGVKHICHQIKQSMLLKECFLIPVGFLVPIPWKNRFCVETENVCMNLKLEFVFRAIVQHLEIIKKSSSKQY